MSSTPFDRYSPGGAQILFRRATLADGTVLYSWRTDPETARYSLSGGPGDLKSHMEWLACVLEDPHRQLLIAEVNGSAIGTVRLDDAPDGWTELSWTVNPEFRGRGFGSKMVGMASREAGRRYKARILSSNEPSLRLVRSCGFQVESEHQGLLTFVKHGGGCGNE